MLGLEQYIDAVVCGDDIDTKPKPHPHNALQICKQLGIDPKVHFSVFIDQTPFLPQEAFMVGDTLADVKMAKAANLGGSIGVLSGVASHDELKPHSDHILRHVGELPRLLSTRLKHSISRCALRGNAMKMHIIVRPLPEESTHSHIIIGAGSAGCVLANRLSAEASVCLDNFFVELKFSAESRASDRGGPT